MSSFKKIVQLSQVMFKGDASASPGFSRTSKVKRSKTRRIIVNILSVVLLMSYSFLFAMGSAKTTRALSDILAINFGLSLVFALMIGLQLSILLLYFSNSNDFFLTLPIQANDLMLAKFMTCWLSMCIFPLIVIPQAIVGGIYNGAGISYYLVSLTLPFLSMICPLALISLIYMLIFSSMKKMPSKDSIMKIVTMVTILLFFGYFFYAQANVDLSSGQAWFTADTDLTRKIFMFINPVIFTVVRAFEEQGNLLYLVPAYLLPILYLGMLYFAARKLYLPILQGGNSKATGKKSVAKNYASPESKFDRRELDKIKNSSSIAALMRVDRLNIQRSPYLFVNLFVTLLMPLFLLFPAILGLKQAMPDLSMVEIWHKAKTTVLLLNQADIRQYFEAEILGWIFVGVIGLFGSIFSSSQIAVSAFSREGNSFSFLNQLPVSAKRRIASKYLYSLFSGPLIHLVLIMAVAIAIGLPARYLLMLLVLLIATMNFSPCIQILIDIRNLYVDWQDEAELNKRMGVMMKTMAILLTNALLNGLIAYAIMNYWPTRLFHPVLFLIFPVIVSVGAFSLLFTWGSKQLVQR